jgi:hypothetical protein
VELIIAETAFDMSPSRLVLSKVSITLSIAWTLEQLKTTYYSSTNTKSQRGQHHLYPPILVPVPVPVPLSLTPTPWLPIPPRSTRVTPCCFLIAPPSPLPLATGPGVFPVGLMDLEKSHLVAKTRAQNQIVFYERQHKFMAQNKNNEPG